MYRYYSWQSINFSGILFPCLEKHDLWKVIQVTLGTLYTRKQGQWEILSSWLIKCVAGGVICHSPVVIPRWGRAKLFVDTFLWSALAPSTLNTHAWTAGLPTHFRMFDVNRMIGKCCKPGFGEDGNLRWIGSRFTLSFEIRSMRISLMTTEDYFRWIPN